MRTEAVLLLNVSMSDIWDPGAHTTPQISRHEASSLVELLQMNNERIRDGLIGELSQYRNLLEQKSWPDPFELPFPGGPGIVPGELAVRFPDLDAAFGATVSLALHSEYSARADALSEAIALCESPIEARFLLSLVCACTMNDLSIWILDEENDELFTTSGIEGDTVLYVMPQAELGDYRVDFALELHFTDPFHRMAAMFGKPKPTNTPEVVIKKLVVECDGHAFHEKTALQAKRDKSRDRDLLADGHPVMRFTGSEIYRAPLRCATQLVQGFFGINKPNNSA